MVPMFTVTFWVSGRLSSLHYVVAAGRHVHKISHNLHNSWPSGDPSIASMDWNCGGPSEISHQEIILPLLAFPSIYANPDWK